MKTSVILSALALGVGVSLTVAAKESKTLTGSYLEVRSCDVYTGSCFANAEMGLTGKEGILVWSIRQGTWDGVALDGLKVIAVVRTDGTLGDLKYQPRQGKAVLIVDAQGTVEQQQALTSFARARAGKLIGEVVSVKALPIQAEIGTCGKSGCATVKAGDVVEVATRCLGGKDHVCGNEEMFYPPLTVVQEAMPAFTEVAAFKGSGLGLTWEATGTRSAFLAVF